jgi:hypothetical protein
MHVTQAIKDKAVLLPVEVDVVSAKDESLVSSQMVDTKLRSGVRNLQTDESRWQDSAVYPVTAIIRDGSGEVEHWLFDPRPRKI